MAFTIRFLFPHIFSQEKLTSSLSVSDSVSNESSPETALFSPRIIQHVTRKTQRTVGKGGEGASHPLCPPTQQMGRPPPCARPCLADCRVTAGTLHAAAQMETRRGQMLLPSFPSTPGAAVPHWRTNWGRRCGASMEHVLTALPGYGAEAKKPTMKSTRDAFPS